MTDKLVTGLPQPWALVLVSGNGQPGRRPPTSVAWLEFKNPDGTYDGFVLWYSTRKRCWVRMYKKRHQFTAAQIIHRFQLPKQYVLTEREVRATKAALPLIEEEPTTACDVCNKQNVEVGRGTVAGIETYACEECSK